MEGCGFRDLSPEFDKLGVRIVGVSFDPPADTARWVEHEKFPFEVWSDESRALALAFGAADSAEARAPSRVTVLLDAEGKVLLRYGSVWVTSHPQDVLEDARRVLPKR